MTTKRKLIVAALATANCIVILVMVILITRSLDATPPSLHTPTLTGDPTEPDQTTSTPSSSAKLTGEAPRPQTLTPVASSLETCQWKAAQLLAQTGLRGAVTLTPDGLLRFDITYLPATAGEAAQLVWTAFDVALALIESECSPFTRVQVTVQGDQPDLRISASVSAADLAAFGAGELSENEFIECVIYITSGNP
jgi:hypothetical protein